jgi:site-specific recombinase XerD
MINDNYPSITQYQQLVELKDYRPVTKYGYVRLVRKLAAHFKCDPATLSENQIREYFVFLRQEKHWQGSAMTQARVALRSFFRESLKGAKDWTVFEDLRIARPQPLPLVLTREEVARVLSVLQQPRFKVCLRLIYHCGLRVGEGVSLAPHDIHGRENPPRLHIKNAKGGKDRYVPIAAGMVEELRQWWRSHHNRCWLFPAEQKGLPAGTATRCMQIASVQEAFALARQESGIHPGAHVHTLRHSYATHMLEAGVNIRQLRDYLGHHSLDTTMIYTHLTALSEARTQATMQTLYQTLNG